MSAIEKLGRTFDAVTIDEGQDFQSDWFDVLVQLLRDPERSYLYIFYDPLQDIYGKEPSFPIAEPAYELRDNCRNTKRIAEFVSGICDFEYGFPDGQVPGEKVEHYLCSTSEERLEKVEAIVRMLIAGDMKPSQIVILSPDRKERSCLAGRDEICGRKLSSEVLDLDADCIRFSTLHGFKGLEADAVIVCDVDGEPPNCDLYHQYVSMSRAKHLLFGVHSDGWRPPRTGCR